MINFCRISKQLLEKPTIYLINSLKQEQLTQLQRMGNCQDNVKVLNELGHEQDQSHLMTHWQNLPTHDKRRTFQQQLNRVNVNDVIKMYKKSSRSSNSKNTQLGSSTQTERTSSTGEFNPIPDSKIIQKQQILKQKIQFDNIGLQAIKNGQVAVFILSGNQSPQLGIEQPLGIYDVGLDSNCNIFQILVRKLARLQKISGAEESNKIKLYIMTNTENKNEIKNHFKSKNYFDYGQNNVFFFSQAMQPIVEENGKIVLKNEANIFMSPRGNGMIFAEMKQKNLLKHLQNQGIKYVFFGPINNILLKIADPTTLGCLIKQNKQIVATCVRLNDQSLGCFGLTSDLKHIKVYEDKINNKNRKWFNTGSCYMTVDFLNSVINNDDFIRQIQQNFQDVIKQMPVYDAKINQKVLTKCLHFQAFYHKVFELTNSISIVEVDPAAQFAPIRNNRQGKYSIMAAREAVWNWHKQILAKEGVNFEGEGHVEMHPALTYEGQNISQIIKTKNLPSTIKMPEFII